VDASLHRHEENNQHEETIMRFSILCRVTATVGVALLTIAVSAQTNTPGARFNAVAINTGDHLTRTFAERVHIVVNRWSTTGERDRLLKALFEKGPEKLLDVLTDMPRVGYFRTPNSLAYDLRYAQREALPDGGERATLLTDRYISFWEAANRTRTLDYPFTMIELQIKPNGVGEGKMSLAAKITGDGPSKSIFLENYATQPVRLSDVRREK
jgi:hypothetical protein